MLTFTTISSSGEEFTLRLLDQLWVKCRKLRVMIGLLQEILCFWKFTKIPSMASFLFSQLLTAFSR
jgi:hypothetical protein